MNSPGAFPNPNNVSSIDQPTGLPIWNPDSSVTDCFDIYPTGDQHLIVEMLRDFGKENLSEQEVLRLDRDQIFCKDILKKLYELQLINISLSEEMGGAAMGHLVEARVAEELAAFCSGVAASALANSLALKPIDIAGTSEQKARFGKALTDQHGLASFCLTEPGAGSNPAQLITKLTPDGGGGFRLSGTKLWATAAAYANQFTVAARVEGSKGADGISVVIVPRGEGVLTSKSEDKLGQRASNAAEVVFDNVRVEADQIVGELGKGFPIFLRTLARARANVAMIAVGIARQAFGLARAHVMSREQFGTLLSQNQVIGNHLADAATKIKSWRLLGLDAARLHDLGQEKEATLAASMAKLAACEGAPALVMKMLELHGGTGYSNEALISKLLRDVAVMPIYEGTSDIQRMIIAKAVLKK